MNSPESLAVTLLCELAEEMDVLLIETSEKTAGMRKLLEANDCFVRARLLQVDTDPEDLNPL